MNIIILFISFNVLIFTQFIATHPTQTLRDLSIHASQMAENPANYEEVYVEYIRILLDPAYLNLSAADRKLIDNVNNHFKKLHTTIAKTFMPILSQENIDLLKILIAQALETIYSPATRKVGGIAFKNHVEMIIKSLMTIGQNQNAIENQIKFQWIKPLYLDNQYLSADMKKKLFSLFDNNHYQRWYIGVKNAVLKVAPSSQTPINDLTPSSTPIQPSEQAPENIPLRYTPLTIEVEEEETVETLPMPQPFQVKPITNAPKTTPATPISKPSIPARSRKESSPIIATTQTPQKKESTNLNSIAHHLIQQSLVAPLSTIQSIVAKVQPSEKFSLLKITDNSHYTALHSAASLARADIVAFLLQNLTPNERFEIIKMREHDGQTALHLAASAKSAPNKGFKPAITVEELLAGLTTAQKNELIAIRDKSGSTALDIAQGFNKTITDILKRNLTQ